MGETASMPPLGLAHPGYQRHCVRPDCTASFHVVDVMEGRASAEGWRMFRSVLLGCICPAHAGPVIDGAHLPTWLRDPDDDVIVLGIGCCCGWEWHPPYRTATQGEHQDQWVAHLASLDAALLGEDGTDAQA